MVKMGIFWHRLVLFDTNGNYLVQMGPTLQERGLLVRIEDFLVQMMIFWYIYIISGIWGTCLYTTCFLIQVGTFWHICIVT